MTPPQNQELKPCPFCGKAAITTSVDDGGIWYGVECTGSNCSMGPSQEYLSAKRSLAIKAWNKRANDLPLSERERQLWLQTELQQVTLREQLEEARKQICAKEVEVSVIGAENINLSKNLINARLQTEQAIHDQTHAINQQLEERLAAALKGLQDIKDLSKDDLHHHVIRQIYGTALETFDEVGKCNDNQ